MAIGSHGFTKVLGESPNYSYQTHRRTVPFPEAFLLVLSIVELLDDGIPAAPRLIDEDAGTGEALMPFSARASGLSPRLALQAPPPPVAHQK